MKKSGVCKWIAITVAAGLIISGYNYNNIDNADNTNNCSLETSITKEVCGAGIKDTSITGKVNETDDDNRILIITWNEEAPVVDKLSDELDAEVYKPLEKDNYTRTFEDIDMSLYSTYFVNLCGDSKNSIRILRQLADEYYLDGKTIIPVYDSDTSCLEEINELEDLTEGSVWLTGGVLGTDASQAEVQSWLKGLGIFLISETECTHWCQ